MGCKENFQDLGEIVWVGKRGRAATSPLLGTVRTKRPCYSKAEEYGAEFRSNETVVEFRVENNKITAVRTNKGEQHSVNVLYAAAPYAREVSRMTGIDAPVNPAAYCALLRRMA